MVLSYGLHLLAMHSREPHVLFSTQINNFGQIISTKVPILARMAHFIICNPPASLEVGRIFSRAGITVTGSRNSLSEIHVNNLVLCIIDHSSLKRGVTT